MSFGWVEGGGRLWDEGREREVKEGGQGWKGKFGEGEEREKGLRKEEEWEGGCEILIGRSECRSNLF